MAWFRTEAWVLLVALASAGGMDRADARADDGPPGRSGVLEGLVVRADGGPVAGALVVAAPDRAPEMENLTSIHQGRTDAAGRFVIDGPKAEASGESWSLWAYQPGLGLARIALAAVRPAEAHPLRVVLAPLPAAATASVCVLDPQGSPMVGGRVSPRLWYEGGWTTDSTRDRPIPPPLADVLAATTDAEGRATLAGVPALHLAGVATEVPGTSARQFAGWASDLTLRARGVRRCAVGVVEGQVRGDDDQARAGWAVEARTRTEGQVVGIARATTDQEGRFLLDGVAAGPVEVRAEAPDGSDEVAARAVVSLHLAPDRPSTVAVRVRRGVRVAGRVVDHQTGGAVAGATVALSGPEVPERRVATGPDGRFGTVLRTQPNRVRVVAAPEPYLVPLVEVGDRSRLGRSAQGLGEWTLTLDRGLMLAGTVALAPGGGPTLFDTTGQVRAHWTERDAQGRAFEARSSCVEVGSDGRFRVGPIPSGVLVTLGACPEADALAGPEVTVQAHPDAASVRLTRPSWGNARDLSGCVVDATGHPVAGALVEFRVAPPGGKPGPDSAPMGHRVTSDGLATVVTDTDGRFRHKIRSLGGDRAGWRWWAAAASPDGTSRAVSATATGGSEAEVSFAPILLTPGDGPASLVGQVVGTDGQGIAGASVRDLAGHATTTDKVGRFRIDRPNRARDIPPVLVVEADGYRCSGTVLGDDSGREERPLVVRLARLDQPALPVLDPPTPRPAASVVEAEIARIVQQKDPVTLAALLEQLAEVQPRRALDLLHEGTIRDPRVVDGLQALIARHLARDRSFAEAEPLLDAIESPEARAHARLAVVVDMLANVTPEQRRAQVERAEHEAHGVPDLRGRIALLGRIAEFWADLGQADRAWAVLREAEAGADSLPRATTGALAWAALAPALARLDAAQAHSRLDLVPDPRLADRGRLDAARSLAQRDPAEAARFFREVRDRRLASAAVAEIAYRMAPRDSRLARSLIDSVANRAPVEAAHALGMLAHALAPADRAEATALLRLAFHRLVATARAGRIAPTPAALAEPAHVASALLVAVEAVDPSLVPEFAWQAVALHDARPGSAPSLSNPQRSLAILATLLQPYDPVLALGLFNPNRLDPSTVSPGDLAPTLLAAARLAPDHAARWLATLTHPAQRDRHALLLLATLAPSRAVQEALHVRHLLHLWNPALPSP